MDVSDESLALKDLGTVMNFEPSLFVYFVVALEVGDVGDLMVCWRWFAGIPIGLGDDGGAVKSTVQNI